VPNSRVQRSLVRRAAADLLGPRERTGRLRSCITACPEVCAPALFHLSLFAARGFLDGRESFYFAVLQAFWFRLLVDAKAYECARPAAPAAPIDSSRP